jgi:hypothetical protein
MKNGFKVFDTDTHVLPAAEVIERYVEPDFRPRLLRGDQDAKTYCLTEECYPRSSCCLIEVLPLPHASARKCQPPSF